MVAATNIDTNDHTPVVNEIVKVEGWDLTIDRTQCPRIRDTDLGERLEYSDPAKVRALVQVMRAEESGFDPMRQSETVRWESRPGVLQSRPVEVFYLTEEEALNVVCRAATAKAAEIRQQIIRVFVAYRRGLLTPAMNPQTAILRFQMGSVELPLTPTVVAALLDRLGPPQQPQNHTLPQQPLDPNRGISIEYESDQTFAQEPPCQTIPEAAKRIGISSVKIYPILLQRGIVEQIDPEDKGRGYRVLPAYVAHFWPKRTSGTTSGKAWEKTTWMVRDTDLEWFLTLLKTPQAA